MGSRFMIIIPLYIYKCTYILYNYLCTKYPCVFCFRIIIITKFTYQTGAVFYEGVL